MLVLGDLAELALGKPQLPQIYHREGVFGEMKQATIIFHACDLLFIIGVFYDKSKHFYILITFLQFEKYIYNI